MYRLQNDVNRISVCSRNFFRKIKGIIKCVTTVVPEVFLKVWYHCRWYHIELSYPCESADLFLGGEIVI